MCTSELLKASSDSELSALLDRELPKLIDGLASPSEAVRKASGPLLARISQRVRSGTAVELPLESLAAACVRHAGSAHPLASNISIALLAMHLAPRDATVRPPPRRDPRPVSPARPRGLALLRRRSTDRPQ